MFHSSFFQLDQFRHSKSLREERHSREEPSANFGVSSCSIDDRSELQLKIQARFSDEL